MTNFFSNFDVVVAPPEEFLSPTRDVQAQLDELGGYLLKVNSCSDYFRDMFGSQQVFTTHERQQIKLFAISSFLKRHSEARRAYLPEAEDASGVDVALAQLAEEAVLRGGL